LSSPAHNTACLLRPSPCRCLLLLVLTPPPSHLLPHLVPWSWSSSQAPCCAAMDWFRSLRVFCHVRRPPDGISCSRQPPDRVLCSAMCAGGWTEFCRCSSEPRMSTPSPTPSRAVRSPLHRRDPMLPLLARCLMKCRREMSFLGTPSLVSTCSVGRTTP
jgi:hypothetical protein